MRSLAVVQCTSMVALAPITNETPAWDVLDTFPKLHSRAREAITTSCTEVAHSKSLVRVEIWLAIYESRVGLESFTRDPIGYEGSEWDLYEFLDSRVLLIVDPDGQCPGPPKARTDEECCDDGKKLGLDVRKDWPKPGDAIPDVGGVLCCDGKMVACAWIPGGASGAQYPPAIKVIEYCTKVHERKHFPHSEPCPKKPGTTRPDGVPKWPEDKAECQAYLAEYQCLKTRQGFSQATPDPKSPYCNGDPTCESEVNAELKLVIDRGKKFCGNAGIKFP